MKNKILIYSVIIQLLLSCSNETNKKDMGIFDRFKNKKVELTSEMMIEDHFWSIIEVSKNTNNDLDEYAKNLSKNLSKLSTKEIVGFHLREQKLRFDSYTSDLWCAGYIMNGGCSDDSFEYFRCWIIAQGKDAFYFSLKKPDYLASLYSTEIDDYDFEDMMYVASDAFEKKTGKDIEDFIDYKIFKTNEANYANFEFTWEEDNEESMKKICPKLMEIAWN